LRSVLQRALVQVGLVEAEGPIPGQADHQLGEAKRFRLGRRGHRRFAHAAGDQGVERPIVARGDDVDVEVNQVADDLVKHPLDRAQMCGNVLIDRIDDGAVAVRRLKRDGPRLVAINRRTGGRALLFGHAISLPDRDAM
jgi:hypothetical protein